MTAMNITEHKGFDWLVRRGYEPATIVFRRRQSPDFVTHDGKGWEVKLARERTITFSPGQVAQLRAHPACSVLIFEAGPEPARIVNMTKLQIPGYAGPFHAILVDYAHLQQMRVFSDAYLAAKAAAAAAGLTLERWASDVLEAAAQRQMTRRKA